MTLASRLAQFERLAAEATPGPWGPNGMGGIRMDGLRDGYSVERKTSTERFNGWCVAHMRMSGHGDCRGQQAADAAYIASLPDLLKLAQDYEKRVKELTEQHSKLAAFADSMLDEFWDSSLDAFDLQDFGVKSGLLVEVEAKEACGETCSCAEYGEFPQTCYRFAPWFKEIRIAIAKEETK